MEKCKALTRLAVKGLIVMTIIKRKTLTGCGHIGRSVRCCGAVSFIRTVRTVVITVTPERSYRRTVAVIRIRCVNIDALCSCQ